MLCSIYCIDNNEIHRAKNLKEKCNKNTEC